MLGQQWRPVRVEGREAAPLTWLAGGARGARAAPDATGEVTKAAAMKLKRETEVKSDGRSLPAQTHTQVALREDVNKDQKRKEYVIFTPVHPVNCLLLFLLSGCRTNIESVCGGTKGRLPFGVFFAAHFLGFFCDPAVPPRFWVFFCGPPCSKNAFECSPMNFWPDSIPAERCSRGFTFYSEREISTIIPPPKKEAGRKRE